MTGEKEELVNERERSAGKVNGVDVERKFLSLPPILNTTLLQIRLLKFHSPHGRLDPLGGKKTFVFAHSVF